MEKDLKANNKMVENFGRVLLTSAFDLKENFSQIPVKNKGDYLKELEKNPKGFCEFVGLQEFQVKPYFDLDPKGEDFDYSLFDEFEADLKKVCNQDVYKAGRDPRIEKDVLKHSRRFYVKARISYSNIPIVFKDLFEKYKGIIDSGVYDPNRRLFAPLSKFKRELKVPKLKVLSGDVFDCCATYILEDYENLDLRISKEQIKFNNTIDFMKKILETDMKDDYEDENDDNDKYLKLRKLIQKLKEGRSANFDSWIKFNWCLINIGNKEDISRKKIERLIHEFSKLSPSNYDEDKVDDWIIKNFDKVRENGYCWNYLYQTCLKEDAPDYYERLTQSYYNVKKDFETNHLKIIHPPFVIYVDENQENIIQPIHLCQKSYRHKVAFIKDGKKDGKKDEKNDAKKIRFIEHWLDDPFIRKFNKMVFKPPPLYVSSQDYNTWTDFEIIKTPYNPNDEIIERFLDYVNNLFDNKEVVDYILAYFANRIQNPAIRNKVCIIIYGEEGDGKNRFLDIFKNIIGKKYFEELVSAKDLFQTHSCFEQEKLFICVNEAKGKDNYENSEILKGRITTETLSINPKGIQAFSIENYCDYLMTTNNHNAVNIKDKSRRYLFVETTTFYNTNSDFFNSFSKDIIDNNQALRVIYEYLMNFDVKNVIPSGNFQKHIPITEIQKTIINDNKDKIELFLRDFVNRDEFDCENDFDETKVKNKVLFAKWLEWVVSNNIKIDYNSISFATRLGLLIKKKKICDLIKRDTNGNIYFKIVQLKELFEREP